MRSRISPYLGRRKDVISICGGVTHVLVTGLTLPAEARAWRFYYAALAGKGTIIRIVASPKRDPKFNEALDANHFPILGEEKT